MAPNGEYEINRRAVFQINLQPQGDSKPGF
jgi:hypothetical protein